MRKFKEGDEVLVRQYDDRVWERSFYVGYCGSEQRPIYLCGNCSWLQCIPYDCRLERKCIDPKAFYGEACNA